MRRKVIGVNLNGIITWHAANFGAGPDHDTLCGLDANDESIGHLGAVEPRRGQKIDCDMCRSIFEGFKELKLRASDFK